ncbi:MAG: aminoglycoside phosphotransferase family protein [Pseudomonadota bacterium]
MSGPAPREERRAAFLSAAGWAQARARPLAGDASNRRYERLEDGPAGARAVLMDAPPERGEDVRPFAAITGLLRARGLSAPEILAADEAAGFLLLEDLGDALLARVCAAEPECERDLYLLAADLLAEVHAERAPEAAGDHPILPYDAETLLREAMLVPDWYLPALGAGSETLADDYAAEVARAVAPVAQARGALVLRDYHAENLLWLPERRGLARLGLLDYQDALRGHPAYDLISLTEDARRDTSPALREAVIRRYLEVTGAEPERFRAAAAILAAQRNLKILGIFARLCRRDGKPAYLDLMPRVWDHLMRDLAHPALSGLAALVRAHIPAPGPATLARLREDPV